MSDTPIPGVSKEGLKALGGSMPMDAYGVSVARTATLIADRRAAEQQGKAMMDSMAESTRQAYAVTPVYAPDGGFPVLSAAMLGILLLFGGAVVWTEYDVGSSFTAFWANMGNEAPTESDDAYYRRRLPEALKLADVPASRLYATYLKGAPTDWKALIPQQKLAVEAAWLRFTAQPEAFRQKLPAEPRAYFFNTFPGLLLFLEEAGVDRAAEHRAKLGELAR